MDSMKAPRGKFRVYGFDDFPQPPERYLVGDFDTAEAAREAAAKLKAQPLSFAVAVDQHGAAI